MKSLVMPHLALGDEEVIVCTWLKQVGDSFQAGEPLLEIETDKATMEVEAPFDGILVAQLYEDGDTVAVGAPYGRAAEPGEDATVAVAAAGTGGMEVRTRPTAVEEAERPEAVDFLASVADEVGTPAGGASARPVVVEHGELAGLPVAPLTPQGHSSRRLIASGSPLRSPTLPAGPLDVAAAAGPHVTRRPGRQRAAIGRRLGAATAIPTFTLERDVSAEAGLRAVAAARQSDSRATLTDVLLRVCALASKAQPVFNAWFLDGMILEFERVSIALAVDTPEGVVGPVLRDLDTLTISEIASRREEIVDRARAGRLDQRELAGATLTLSNVAGLGAHRITPVLTPPQAVAVGIGSARSSPDGSVLAVTFVGDHRVLDGADGARFLAAFTAAMDAAG